MPEPAAGRKPSLKRLASLAAFPLFIAALLALAYAFRGQIMAVVGSREAFRSWILARGAWAVPAFILVQFVQVVIFVIPGEVAQVAGGFVFGAPLGSLWSIIGILLGSAFNFFLARLLGAPFIEAVAGKERMAKFDSLASSRSGEVSFFLFFLVPGIPKDILCYVAGASRMAFPSFLLVSTLGRLPGIVGSCLIGSAAQKGNWLAFALVAAVAAALFGLGLIFQKRLHSWIIGLAERKKDDKGR